MVMRLIIMLAVAYLVGSIPTAYLMGRLLRGIDIRRHGSGNVGATNVMRVLGAPAGIATLSIDLIKGLLVVAYAAPALYPGGTPSPVWQIAACIAVVVGHNWMLFLRFTGGKGVATAAGAFLALSPLSTISAVAVWGVVVALTRYVSLGSILAGIALPVFMLLYRQPVAYCWFAGVLTAVLVIKHRSNIKRLIAGTERKIGQREKM